MMHIKSYVLYSLVFIITLSALHYYINQSKVISVRERGVTYQEKDTIQSTFGYDEPVTIFYEDEREIENSEYFLKDDFGNYILSEMDLEAPDKIPVNENGKILYNVYTDGNGDILNPMPDYYAHYEEYFEVGHSIFE
jgi:hypothetical protein